MKADNIELIRSAEQWNDCLVKILRCGRPTKVMTYTMPHAAWFVDIFSEALAPVELICHVYCRDRATLLAANCPHVTVGLHPGTHAKCVISEPNAVMIGSVNLGCSGWAELGVGIRSEAMCRSVIGRVWQPAWRLCEKLRPSEREADGLAADLLA